MPVVARPPLITVLLNASHETIGTTQAPTANASAIDLILNFRKALALYAALVAIGAVAVVFISLIADDFVDSRHSR
jgi:hypothetical protein